MPRPQVLSLHERLSVDPELRGRGVCIGFVDVGFYPHPDLVRPERRVLAYVDVAREEPLEAEFFMPQPFSWHGTMATCCAVGNGYLSGGRYRGLASEAHCVLLKAGVEGGLVRGANVAAALRFPLKHPELGIRVLNVSLGVDRDDPHARDVERAAGEAVAAGVVVIAAAGNAPGRPPEPPATCPEVLTVGGQDDKNTPEPEDDTPWPSSAGEVRPGVHKPDLLAPALRVPAPMLPGTLTAREANALFQLLAVLEDAAARYTFERGRTLGSAGAADNRAALLEQVERRIEQERFLSPEYQHVSGTSFAAPITASIAAQMLEACPSLTPAQVREGLLSTARPLQGVPREVQGAGVLRPLEATAWARAQAHRRKGASP